MIYVKHNLFQQSKWSRTIDLILELATKQPFGRLLIDLDPKTSDALRYSSNIVPPGPSTFYLPSAKAVITNLTDERERSMYASTNATIIGYQVKKVNQVSY